MSSVGGVHTAWPAGTSPTQSSNTQDPAGPGDAIDLRRAVEALETAVVGGVTGAGVSRVRGKSGAE
jgi:hypothetical protein